MIDSVMSTIRLITDVGISTEINAFFEDELSIEAYRLSLCGNIYQIEIKMKVYNRQKAKKIFHDFLFFMEYSALSYYETTELNKSISYNFITASHEHIGFRCFVMIK